MTFRGRPIEPLALGLVVLIGTVVAGYWALSVDEWRVMTDELGYVKIAVSISDTLSPVSRVRGESIHNYGILYPALLAPVVGLLDMPTAFRLAHGLGAFLMVSAAIPAYLLATFVSRSRAVGLAAAAPVALTPWLLLAMNLLTEVLAYPVFVWAMYASVLAVAEPSRKRDAAVLVALVLLFLARTQFIFVFGLLPVAIVLHEVGARLPGSSPRTWARESWLGLRASVANHVVLCAAGVLGALFALAAGDRILGGYGAVRSGTLFPPAFAQAAYDHLNQILLGVAVLPLVLALAYLAETLVRPGDRRAHAFAVHLLLIVPALLVIVTSFDLQFAGGVHERYLFYVAPLLFIAAACYVRSARWPLFTVGGAGVLTALILTRTTFEPVANYPIYASPTRAAWVALDFRVGQVRDLTGIDLSNGLALAIGTAAAAAILVWLLQSARRRVALAGLGLALALWGVALTAYSAPKVRAEHESLAVQGLGTTAPLDDRDWIDDALPSGATAGLVPSIINARAGIPIPSGTVTEQGVWWEAEFWNKSVVRSYVYRDAIDYAPYKREAMTLDRRSGALRVTGDETPYLVVAKSNVRVAPEGEVVASRGDLDLYEPTRPYRAEWATGGVSDGGATRGDRGPAHGVRTPRVGARIPAGGARRARPARAGAVGGPGSSRAHGAGRGRPAPDHAGAVRGGRPAANRPPEGRGRGRRAPRRCPRGEGAALLSSVTVAIPVLDGRPLLDETLAAVRRQRVEAEVELRSGRLGLGRRVARGGRAPRRARDRRAAGPVLARRHAQPAHEGVDREPRGLSHPGRHARGRANGSAGCWRASSWPRTSGSCSVPTDRARTRPRWCAASWIPSSDRSPRTGARASTGGPSRGAIPWPTAATPTSPMRTAAWRGGRGSRCPSERWPTRRTRCSPTTC